MTEVDFFVVAGQSNAKGRGDSSQSPDPAQGTAYEYDYSNDTLVHLDDPVDGASTGSAWPAFAVRWNELSGRPMVVVGTAEDGSAQQDITTDPDGNWDTGGSLYDRCVNRTEEALTYLENNGYEPDFRGILWSQGEADARDINEGEITKAEYKSALVDMLSRFRSDFRSDLPFYIHETARRTNQSVRGTWDVQDAQREVVREQTATFMASDVQASFPERGLMSDNVHYNQAGYNEMGTVSATTIYRLTETMGIQHNRGTTEEHGNYVGKEGEITVDTEKQTAVVHDGTNAGTTLANFQGVSVRKSGSVTVDGSSNIVFDETDFDDRNEYDNDTGEVVIQNDGRYLIEASFGFSNSITADKYYRLNVRVNGTRAVADVDHASVSDYLALNASALVELSAGDVVTVVLDGSVASAATVGDKEWNTLQVVQVG